MSAPDFNVLAEKLKAAGATKNEVDGALVLLDRRKFAKAYLKDPATRKRWEVRDYQQESVNWRGPRKVHRSARSTGKTKDLEICALNIAMTDPGQELLIGAQRRQHLEPLMERLIRVITTTPDFANSLERRPQRSPDYRIDFKNGFKIWGRIAGPFGQNFQGMHVKYQFCEESQEWTDKAWNELIPGLNPGGSRFVYGVPNGVHNKYYDITQDKKYKLFSWSRLLDKTLTEDDLKDLKNFYGGEHSPDYQHYILGIHGKRRFATFDYDHYQQCVSNLHCPVIKITAEEYKQDPKRCKARLNFPYKLPFQGEKYLGGDIGYSNDPTELVGYVWDGKHFANYFRIHLEGLKTNEQRDIITILDDRHKFTGIGIDRGGIGLGVEHELQALNSRFAFIVKGFHWGENLVVAIKQDNTEDKREAKLFSTFLIEEALRTKTIMFPRDLVREEQYINMTHEVRPNGYVVYSDTKDHIVDADRNALLVKHMIKFTQGSDEVDLGVRIRAIRTGR